MSLSMYLKKTHMFHKYPPVLLWQVPSPRGPAEVDLLQLTHRHLGRGMHHGGALHPQTPVPWQQRGGRDLQDLSGAGNAEEGEPSHQVSHVVVHHVLYTVSLKSRCQPVCLGSSIYFMTFVFFGCEVFVTHLLFPLVFHHISRTGLRASTWPPRWTSASQSVSPPASDLWSPTPATRRSHWWKTCCSGTLRKDQVLLRYI